MAIGYHGIGHSLKLRIWRSDKQESQCSAGPDFICFGMQKAGTRWLFDQMNSRRDVWMPPIKEINYFTETCLKATNLKTVTKGTGTLPVISHADDELKSRTFFDQFRTFQPGHSDINWYRKLFVHKGERKSGDISPAYGSLDAGRIARIATDFPDTQFVVLIREPISRLWSALCMDVRKDILHEEQICSWKSLQPKLLRRDRTMKSFPSELWRRWSQEIPQERIRFWFLDDIIAKPADVVNEICEHVGIEPGEGALPPDFNSKSGDRKIEMPTAIRDRLVEHFAAELEACATLFGSHAIRWRDQSLGQARQAA